MGRSSFRDLRGLGDRLGGCAVGAECNRLVGFVGLRRATSAAACATSFYRRLDMKEMLYWLSKLVAGRLSAIGLFYSGMKESILKRYGGDCFSGRESLRILWLAWVD